MFSVAVLQLFYKLFCAPKPWCPNSLTHMSPSCRKAPEQEGTMYVTKRA